MNRAQKLLLATVSRVVPDFRRLMEAAGGSLRVADRTLAALLAQQRSNEAERQSRIAEMREAYELSGSGPEMCALIEGKPVGIQEAYASNTRLKESLWELELALEDRGWQRQLALASLEYSRYGIQQLILMSRLYALKNPLIKRGVYISSYYVFGRGVEITSDDEDAADTIKTFLADQNNSKEFGHIGLVNKHKSLQTDGNLFFVFFVAPGSGAVQVRTIDPTEIYDKITDPDDSSVDWYYRRNWAPVKFDASNVSGYTTGGRIDEWYPALNFNPPDKPTKIGGKTVNWESPVLHIKVGSDPKWKFGCPEVYAAINDARAYADFLKDWCTIQRALARFSWDVSQPGGQQAIGAVQSALSTTLGIGGTSIESNPPPTVGSVFAHSPGTKMTPVKTAGAQTEPEQARRILLMVAAGFGLPETFFGDASTGSLATAVSLDRPTELKFLADQELWRYVLSTIITFMLTTSMRAAKGGLREVYGDKKVRVEVLRPRPRLSTSHAEVWDIPTLESSSEREAGTGVKTVNVIVKFPAILEHDISAMVTAYQDAATLGGFSQAGTVPLKQLAIGVMSELGIDQPEERFSEMYPNYDAKQGDGTGQDDTALAPGLPALPAGIPPPPAFGKESATMVRQLARYVVEHVNGR